MKKIKRYFAAYLLVFAMIVCAVPAVKAQDTGGRTASDDDIVICVTTIEVISTTEAVTRAAEFKEKTAAKTNTYKTSKGEVMWSVTITATFQYNGTNSGCLTAKATSKSYNSNWKTSDERVSVNGASATGYATGRRYLESKVVETVTKSVGISCSKDGTIS